MLPADWPWHFELNNELVGKAFIIHNLLNWHHDNSTILIVPHKVPNQAIRWHHPIKACNFAMAGMGQPAWSHACNLCTKHVKDAQGDLIAADCLVVTDVISLGHPCCLVHN